MKETKYVIYIEHCFSLKGRQSYWNKENQCFGSIRLASIMNEDDMSYETCVIGNDERFRHLYIKIKEITPQTNP